MVCPNCSGEMAAMELEGNMRRPLTIDVCTQCHGFWFDKYESLQLSPGSTLKLMKFIGEHTAPVTAGSDTLKCPRCSERLKLTTDLQRNTRFQYFRCTNDHGRFTRFFEFLREKNFIRTLTGKEIEELRQNIQSVNCSNCGAPVNVEVGAACGHCGSPLSMLDMKQPQALLEQLRQAAEPKPVSPALALDLAKVKRESDISSLGLVQAGLSAVARWLSKSDV